MMITLRTSLTAAFPDGFTCTNMHRHRLSKPILGPEDSPIGVSAPAPTGLGPRHLRLVSVRRNSAAWPRPHGAPTTRTCALAGSAGSLRTSSAAGAPLYVPTSTAST